VSVTTPAGFVANGVAAGIKPSGDLDLSLVATADGVPVNTAATFTQNKLTAAPVLVTRAHLEATGGRAAAVVLNSGNANAATGSVGVEHAARMCDETAAALGCEAEAVLVCSTGLIGIPLPVATVTAGIPALVAGRNPNGGHDAARAIMTTDTVAKEVVVQRPGFAVGGMAKGAAMLAPNMATMLAVLTTDAAAEPAVLQRVLRAGVASSFNILMTDACTSTNDTVILLASGMAGAVDERELAGAVAEACFSLAAQMAGDAEGATKVVRVVVQGADSDDEALAGARSVARSALCKCSWYGEDPYWGRIGSELGNAGIEFNPDSLSVLYGGTTVAAGGITVDHDATAVKAHMAQRHLEIVADLGIGTGQAFVLTNDLSPGYIDENMRTS
jgi:glutamate N-acetyltransferase / amino-acid N-acetyltransferase